MFDDKLMKVSASIQELESLSIFKLYGKVIAVTGMMIECAGIAKVASVGTLCKIYGNRKAGTLLCEVVGFKNEIVLLMSFEDTEGLFAGSVVEVLDSQNSLRPHESWLGRVFNAFGEAIDGKHQPVKGEVEYDLRAKTIEHQKRGRLGDKMNTGVKAIDAFANICYGQRMGIFAGSGVGKSVLISMLTKYATTDVKVIGLVGERSREVKEFIEEYLGEEGLKKAVIVVATGDESALMRKRAAYATLAIAEYFRDQGKEVLCIIDSITRFAMAQREIGLAIGEPPTTRGYTPSVFAELPQLLERAGPGENGFHITGLFTVLVEGDDHNEPISDAVRGTVDGHIVMSRNIAERGRFPAIDVLKSVSRTMPQCNTEIEQKQISYARKMLALYQDMSEMIN
jgi:flagellum-specific ATP synthase